MTKQEALNDIDNQIKQCEKLIKGDGDVIDKRSLTYLLHLKDLRKIIEDREEGMN